MDDDASHAAQAGMEVESVGRRCLSVRGGVGSAVAETPRGERLHRRSRRESTAVSTKGNVKCIIS